MIRRAASSLARARQFSNRVRAFRETEYGITTESLVKNALGSVFIYGLFTNIGYANEKLYKELKGINAEVLNEGERYSKAMKQLKELRKLYKELKGINAEVLNEGELYNKAMKQLKELRSQARKVKSQE